jgi:hypothetical protein
MGTRSDKCATSKPLIALSKLRAADSLPCALEFRLLPLQVCLGDGALRLLRSSISVIGDSEDRPDPGPQLR